jgi:hypothetical protein
MNLNQNDVEPENAAAERQRDFSPPGVRFGLV